MKKILNAVLLILLVCLSIILYSKYLGVKGLRVKEYKVESEVLTSNFSGIKIVHISDILYGSSFFMEDLENLKEKVNILRPDIIVFTGDLSFKKNLKVKEKDQIIKVLKEMDASLGKYAVYGDYDYLLNDYFSIMEDAGFIVLNNSYDKVYYKNNDYIHIVGLPHKKLDLKKAFEFYNEEERRYIIVLSHYGKTIEKLNSSTYETDLILLGHSLNGSIVIPYYGPLIIPKESTYYYAPEYTKGITKIFVSSGLGTNKYPYRLFNKPSFNLYRLKAK